MDETNLFVPLNAVETLQRAGSLYLQSGTVRLFVKLALLFVIPATAILLTVVYMVMHSVDNNADNGFFNNFGDYVTILMSQSLLQTTLGAIAEGAIAVAVADLYLQRTPRWFVCLQRASTKVATLLLSGFVAGISILVGYCFFYVPGLILKVNFLIVTPVIILEDEISTLSALGRSWDLVKGRRWYVLKCLIGLDSLYWLTNWFLRVFLREDRDHHPFFSLTFHLLKSIPATMITPLFGILKGVVYINLMVIQEGMNEERFAQQVDQGFPAAARVPLLDEEEGQPNRDRLESGDVEVNFEDAQESIPELRMLHGDVMSTTSSSVSSLAPQE